MARKATINVAILFEGELRLAARRLSKWYDAQKDAVVSEDEQTAMLNDAINACLAALYHAAGDGPLMLSSATELVRVARKPRKDKP